MNHNFKKKSIYKDDVLSLLEKCINIYNERTAQYGSWKKNISDAIQEAKLVYNKDYLPEDYLIQMITLKNARNKNKLKEDSIIDKIVYSAMYYITKNNG